MDKKILNLLNKWKENNLITDFTYQEIIEFESNFVNLARRAVHPIVASIGQVVVNRRVSIASGASARREVENYPTVKRC